MPARRTSRSAAAESAKPVDKRKQSPKQSASPAAAKRRAAGDAEAAEAPEVPEEKAEKARTPTTRITFPPRENGAVGVPNRSGSDCFWISTLQCIRHAPGYVDTLRQCTASIPQDEDPKSRKRPKEPSAMELLCSTTQLMNEMDATNELQALAARSPALERFRESCSEALSVKLVDMRMRRQSQQDVHEFLLQLVEALSRSPGGDDDGVGGTQQSSRPSTRNSSGNQGNQAVAAAAPADQPSAVVTDERRAELARAFATSDTQTAETLLQTLAAARVSEASAGDGGKQKKHQQADDDSGSSPTLLMLQHYFMGLRCATMSCQNCGVRGGTQPAAFITEEVGLAAAAQRLRMERAQQLNIQFQKDEVIHCPRCKQLMRAPCEAAALRCAGCRAVINPSDCAENRNLEQVADTGAADLNGGGDTPGTDGDGPADQQTGGGGNSTGDAAGDNVAAGKKKNTGGRTKASGDPPLEPLALKPLLETARVGEILDGYKCDSCSQAGTTHRQDLIFLLPQVYIVHINRAGIGGEIGGDHGDIRHGNPVSFPDSLNLKDCGLLLAPDTPLDWNLEPCSVEFDLFGACFHRGTSARCGHYVAYTKLKGTDDGNGNEIWVELNDAAASVSGPPMNAESTIDNKKAVLLWYSRRALV